MNFRISPLLAFPVIAIPLVLAGCGGDDSDPSVELTPAALASGCKALNGKTLAGVTVTATAFIDAAASLNPALCKVSGTRAPFLDIEVDLPASWSGRYWQNGGGGFNGTIPSGLTMDAAGKLTAVHPMIGSRQAVYAASNGGNRSAVAGQAAPAVWASGTADGKESATDYAYRSLETTLTFAKAAIQQIYGRPATYRYFNGCSNGGREAYIVAERWPDDFDGIVSGCETGDMATQTAAWLNLAKVNGTPAALAPAQYTDAYSKAVAACDANDGVADGYLANPASCTFDPALLECGTATASADPALCLSPAQVQTLKGLMSSLKSSDGNVLYAGFDWSDFSAFGPSFGALGGGFAMLATGDPSWLTAAKQNTFDADRDYPAIKAGLAQASADHDPAAIAAFAAAGKKLLSWHASGDNLLSAREHARRQEMLFDLVKSQGVADPSANARFMLVPANFHGYGSSLKEVGWDTAIVDWVEGNVAPTQLTYSIAATSGTAARTLPVCLSPKTPFYNGSGDIRAASSYSCR